MRMSVLTAACSLVLTLSSGVAFAQNSSDAAASPSAGMTKSAKRAENHQLSKAVRHALYTTKGLVSSNIAVISKDGAVSLVGTVPTDSQIPLAGQVAQGVPNVKSVDNRIVVEDEGGGP
jgi:hyperosmotically inducible protein